MSASRVGWHADSNEAVGDPASRARRRSANGGPAAYFSDAADPADGRDVYITVPARRLVLTLSCCIAVLALLHVLVMSAHYLYFTFDRFRYFATVVNLNQESNPATWLASLMLLIGGVLQGIIAADAWAQPRPFARQWSILALVFLALSLDETAMLHERTIVPMRQVFNLSGPFFYGWVVLAIPLLLAFGLWYFRFFLRLPRGFRWQLILAAAVYLSGALGVEMVEGWYDETQGGIGESDLTFSLLVAVEETCEMIGVLVLIHALLGYIRQHIGAIQVRLAP